MTLQRILSVYILISALVTLSFGQGTDADDKIASALNRFFITQDTESAVQTRVLSWQADNRNKTIDIEVSSSFASQEFTSQSIKKTYKKLSRSLPKPYNKYKIRIIANGLTIDEYVPGAELAYDGRNKQWGDIEYNGKPWVVNTSRPNEITHGLYNRHLAISASHGMYYDQEKSQWKWQRPNIFCTTEDLFTQTIVVPYLIPMLENAGAIVFTPRERDYQTNEIIIDNNKQSNRNYRETVGSSNTWVDAPSKGFALHGGNYSDGENPFNAGTARMTKTVSKKKEPSTVSYQPDFPEEGRYAVYVSYQTLPSSIADAQYTVVHKGIKTTFSVNQTMGGKTWVYLGTFDFAEGYNEDNCVVVSNVSSQKGIVTTDAVRFGGGMGNIQRGGTTSSMPRCLEGSRYTAQWYGAPYSVYSKRNGTNDYADDINARSLMTNWMGGGSAFMPSLEGLKVPIELCLAVHSDAGYSRTKGALTGTLTICTTDFNDGRLNSGVSRMMSKDFADSLLTSVTRDLRMQYGRWTSRVLFDRNYSETRLPEVPSSIIETLSHQNFYDMCYGHDPNFKFTLARSLYKTILRFVSTQHGRPYIVQPLAPDNFRIEISGKNKIRIAWTPTVDATEPTATPTAYKLYTSIGKGGFDNGIVVVDPFVEMEIEPGIQHNFYVTAINRGGESFPTETLSAYISPKSEKTIMIVNGFHRLSSPEQVDNGTAQGFDLTADAGVQRGAYLGWNGEQQCFDKRKIGVEGPGGLGYSGDEMAGHVIMGNAFNDVVLHTDAMAYAGKYNVASCSSKAVEAGIIDLSPYDCVDLLLGLERDDGHSLVHYKSLSAAMQARLSSFARLGKSLLVSGAYVGMDQMSAQDKAFLADVLKASYAGSDLSTNDTINGLGRSFAIYRTLCVEHYAASSVDVLQAKSPAFCTMLYANGQSAAVAYDGNDYKAITMGFPFECISDEQSRRLIMSGMLNFLIR